MGNAFCFFLEDDAMKPIIHFAGGTLQVRFGFAWYIAMHCRKQPYLSCLQHFNSRGAMGHIPPKKTRRIENECFSHL